MGVTEIGGFGCTYASNLNQGQLLLAWRAFFVRGGAVCCNN